MAESLSPRTQRYLFIDVYRSAVILLMLEGHIFRTFLPPSIQRSEIFQLHEFLHGLSAPAFLFGAGLTFVISTRKRWIEYHHWGNPLARRVKRLLFVLLLGFAIHLPYFSMRKIVIDGTTADYLQLFQFDVLHCIGIGLLSLHALVFFFKKESRFYGLVLSTIVMVCFLTPLIWEVDFLQSVPSWLSQMFNGVHGSPFPLFPYVGFLFTGVIVSWEFLIAAEEQRQRQFVQRLFVLGAAFIIIGMVFDLVPLQIYPKYNYWFTSPNYFLVRVGSLMIITAGFWYLAQMIQYPKQILTVLGRESLFVYVLHLVVLYGSAVNPSMNLQVILGNNLSVAQTVGVFTLFLTMLLLVASLWNYLKDHHFFLYRLTQLGGSAAFLYYFFTRDF